MLGKSTQTWDGGQGSVLEAGNRWAGMAMSTFSPISLQSANGMRMCVCVCVCVCWRNELKVCTMLAYIAVHSVLCQCCTDTSTCTHASSETIWGQQTDRTKSGYCRWDWVWLDSCCVLRLCRLLIPRFFPLVFHTYRLLLFHSLPPVSVWVVAFVLIRDVRFLWFMDFLKV